MFLPWNGMRVSSNIPMLWRQEDSSDWCGYYKGSQMYGNCRHGKSRALPSALGRCLALYSKAEEKLTIILPLKTQQLGRHQAERTWHSARPG